MVESSGKLEVYMLCGDTVVYEIIVEEIDIVLEVKGTVLGVSNALRSFLLRRKISLSFME
jgi:hypothetical protein